VSAAYARLLEALSSHGYKYKADGRGRARAQCPSHNGEDLNLAIAIGDQGVLLRCHSYDCPAEDIAKAVGLELRDLFDQDGHAIYHYANGHDVLRFRTRDGKEIVQRNHPGKITELYRDPASQRIEDAEFVVVVEGEKSVDAALRLGLPCVTTWPGGASAVDHVNIDPLIGKRIRLIADNDEPGRAAMAHLEARLRGMATVESISTAPIEKQGVDDIWLDGGELSDLVPLDVSPYKADQPEPERRYSLRDLTKVRTRKARFLWDGVLPYGSLVLFGGKGGTGKSTFAIWLAGLLTVGKLKGHLFGEPGNVLYVSHEDGVEEIVVPRLIANGVDIERFRILDIHAKNQSGVSIPRLPEDMELIRQAVREFDAKLVIIDPITSTLSGDNDKLADVRAMLDPLNQMGQELGVGVIAIAHFKKGAGSQSDMVSGSHAYRDASRAMLLFAKEEHLDDEADDNPPTIITLDKSNVGPSGQSYQFQSTPVEIPLDDGQMGTTTRIDWLGGSKQNVGQIINREQSSGQGALSNDIKNYLDSLTGAVGSKEILAAFPDEKQSTVYSVLKRLKQRGLIDSPAWGVYQSVRFAPKGAV
jgi:hypothetical protein